MKTFSEIKQNNPFVRDLHPDIVLSNGAIVKFSYMDNGAQAADIVGRGMTNEEYVEFINILHDRK